MFTQIIERARAFNRWANDGFAPNALILLYHRIIQLPRDPFTMNVTPQHFAEHLDVIRGFGFPIRLQELVQGLRDGTITRKAIVITLDDGYADNLHNAKPLLERYGVPATVFVASGYLDGTREFWWDELDRIILQSASLPDTLNLNIDGIPFHWESGILSRHHLLHSLHHLLHPLCEDRRKKLLKEILAWSGVEHGRRLSHRTLSFSEVGQLTSGGLVEVGCHTVNHDALSRIPLASQEAEINTSKACLENIIGRRVLSFAYPYGTRTEYTKETMAAVREAGLNCACSVCNQGIRRGADCFQLPRIPVHDWDKKEFTRRLKIWFRS